MVHVALEVPLAAFDFRGFDQRDDAGAARIQVLGEAADGAAFAGCIATFEEDQHLLTLVLDPVLQFHQFDLQREFLFEIVLQRHALLVRIAWTAEVIVDRSSVFRRWLVAQDRSRRLIDVQRIA